jgi:hypothetical protein
MEFILEVLGLLAELDCYSEPIYWACHGDYAPITFFVNCNDLFYWATADAEKLTPEDMPALKQAIADVIEITGKTDIYIGFELWCARKREMRPQQPAYPKDEQLRALFDACGPPRTSTEEG